MSTYKPPLPPSTSSTDTNPLDPRVPAFFESFYATSDDPSDAAHERYVDSMTNDGTLIMGSKTAKGREEIMGLRRGLWSGPVKAR